MSGTSRQSGVAHGGLIRRFVGARLSLYCNCSGGTWDCETYFGNHLRLTFGFPSYAEIRTAEVADRVIVIMRAA